MPRLWISLGRITGRGEPFIKCELVIEILDDEDLEDLFPVAELRRTELLALECLELRTEALRL